ncbi:MAG: hypothetical protein Ct9H90mP25_1180 [Gammaproteobacteria bacterium]|nr:MAG: hypothetical protein Ct9H90mP25_1180 [Gammaproteobacteria bacterium]
MASKNFSLFPTKPKTISSPYFILVLADQRANTSESVIVEETPPKFSIRQRLFKRGLSFAPQAAFANGDHIYWDLHTWQGDGARKT